MESIEIIRPSGEYRSQDRGIITDVTGAPVADLGLAPNLLVNRAFEELREGPAQSAEERLAAMAAAGELFATAELDGEKPDDYCAAVSRVVGMPLGAVQYAQQVLADMARDMHKVVAELRPVGAVMDWREEKTRGGAAVWVPKGRVLACRAPGNQPGPHSEWLVALGLGYRVAVRPSGRDPYTPRRLVRALLAGGVDPSYLTLLPTGHNVAETFLQSGDLGLVFGGDNVVRRYHNDPRVLVRGPGRSKILITADTDWREHLEVLIEAVAGGGGSACINTTAIFVEGDARGLAEELAVRLSELPVRPPEDPGAALPVRPLAEVERMGELVARMAAADGVTALHKDPVPVDLGDGSAALRPAVFLLDDARQPQARTELLFPCVWVAPWTRETGAAVVGDSLVLTLLSGDEDLMDACVEDPTIRNLYNGPYSTGWLRTDLPHDGNLAEFLMHTRTMVR